MNNSRGSILIIDDMPENLQYLSRLLNMRNYQVRALPNAKLAMQSIFSHPPDLVLLDIVMPEVNGYDVCRLLKSNETTKDIPVIFISGVGSTESIIKGFQSGGVDYITKPFRNEEVYARIENQMQLKRKTDELEELLSKTLKGSIQAILDILAFVDPDAYRKANQCSKAMDHVIDHLKLEEPWKFHIAAMMSTLGTFSISKFKIEHDDIKVGHDNRVEEIETASYLISKLPQLENITEMLLQSSLTSDYSKEFSQLTLSEQGGLLLRIIDDVYELIKDDNKIDWIKVEITRRYEQIDSSTLYSIVDVLVKSKNENVEKLKVTQLRPGMVLAENVTTKENVKLLSEGTELSFNIIHLLEKRIAIELIKEPIRVFTN